MNIYLASRYAEKRWLSERVVPVLIDLGHTITSRWVLTDHDGALENDDDKIRFATEDLVDLMFSDASIHFLQGDYYNPNGSDARISDWVPASWARGGRHVEFGFVLGMRMFTANPETMSVFTDDDVRLFNHRIITVGGRENIFHYLRPDVVLGDAFQIEHYDSWNDCVRQLQQETDTSATDR